MSGGDQLGVASGQGRAPADGEFKVGGIIGSKTFRARETLGSAPSVNVGLGIDYNIHALKPPKSPVSKGFIATLALYGVAERACDFQTP